MRGRAAMVERAAVVGSHESLSGALMGFRSVRPSVSQELSATPRGSKRVVDVLLSPSSSFFKERRKTIRCTLLGKDGEAREIEFGGDERNDDC
mmetsp:Transcript_27721/g.41248  ORF Transcript_27721/g.41248 Transcript_27721/m.41248 type:complete len:93 (+) Transcript_27721:1160-1438(+)